MPGTETTESNTQLTTASGQTPTTTALSVIKAPPLPVIRVEIIEVLRDTVAELAAKCPPIVKIETEDDYRAAVEFVRAGKEQMDSAEKRMRPDIDLLHQAHRFQLNLLKEILQPLAQKVADADYVATAWYKEQERLAKVREAELRRMEQERIEKEQKDRDALLALETERLRKEAEDHQLAAAEKAEKLGMPEVAEDILKQPVHVDTSSIVLPPAPIQAPIVVERTAPPISGRSYRSGWDFEITDERAIPREFCSSDPKKIRAEIVKMDGAAKIPGVRIFPKTISSTRK